MTAQNARSGEPAPHTALKYRPDIDGLRAIAVIAVIWFHSGLPGMPGGYTGVDVFFVISGYLITSIIHRDMREGSFSFRRFYERRFRRIAPALVTVIGATTVASFALLLPYELDAFAKSAAAAVAMVSNVYFWRSLNYFAPEHSLAPLLHSWSLGVEEQFYLLFPLTLVIAERFGKPRLAIAALGIGSFVLCVAITEAMPAASFYLIPARGWELMIGASLAVGLVSIRPSLQQAAAIAGIALTITAGVLIGPDDPFPGWRALVPTIGAALVIGGGTETIAARALSFPPLVYVGRISYSFYLWHWPIFVFLRHWRANPELSPVLALIGIGAAFLLSVASYRWIERPARDKGTPFRRVLRPSIAGAAAVLVASAIAVAGRGLPQRLPARVDALAAVHDGYAPLAHACVTDGTGKVRKICHFGPVGEPQLLLWGDSHAAAISEAVGEAIGRPGILISVAVCPPVVDWPEGTNTVMCRSTDARTLRFAEADSHLKMVVLSVHWAVLNDEAGPAGWAAVQHVVDRLKSAGKTVIVVAGVPDPGLDVPWTSAIRARFGRPPVRLNCPPAHVPLHGVTIVDVSAGFCRKPAYLLFTDANHPSRYAGLAIIAPAIRKALEAAH
jgi:peptidoglycan/LPS O-acetylase OafA/YrhL